MKFNLKELSPAEVSVKTSIDKNELQGIIDLIYQELGKNVTLPRFRKGKAPLALIKMQYPLGAIEQDLKKEIAARSFYEFKNQYRKEYMPVDFTSSLKHITISDDGAQLEFTTETYKLLKKKLPVELSELREEEIDAYIDRLKESYAALKDVDGREILHGDYCFLEFIDGENIESIVYRYGIDHLFDGLDGYLLESREGKPLESLGLDTFAREKSTVDLSEKAIEMMKSKNFKLKLSHVQRREKLSNDELLKIIEFNGDYADYREHVKNIFREDELKFSILSGIFSTIPELCDEQIVPKTLLSMRRQMIRSVIDSMRTAYTLRDVMRDQESYLELLEYMRPFAFGYSLENKELLRLILGGKRETIADSMIEKLAKESAILFSYITCYNVEALNMQELEADNSSVSEVKKQLELLDMSFENWREQLLKSSDAKAAQDHVGQLVSMVNLDLSIMAMLKDADFLEKEKLIEIYRNRAAHSKKLLYMF
jgi:trigger factor